MGKEEDEFQQRLIDELERVKKINRERKEDQQELIDFAKRERNEANEE